jgi:hypothetical protein
VVFRAKRRKFVADHKSAAKPAPVTASSGD